MFSVLIIVSVDSSLVTSVKEMLTCFIPTDGYAYMSVTHVAVFQMMFLMYVARSIASKMAIPVLDPA